MNKYVKKALSPFVSISKKKVGDFDRTEITWNIKNYSINYLLSPIYFSIITFILHKLYKYPLWLGWSNYNSAYALAIISSFFYCYTSTFFQPDLDQELNRPGKHTFPCGDKIQNISFGKIKIGSMIRDLCKPITFIWYWSWHPYGKLVTHRGASHYPIYGVWMRVAWLFVIFLFVEGVFFILGIKYPVFLYYWKYWLKSFFPWNKEFLSIVFWVFCFPIYIADIFHSAVDLIESITKNTPFCSHLHKRGYIIKLTKMIITIPKTILDQSRSMKE